MMILKLVLGIIITAVVSYLLGSLNSAIITVRLLKNEDIRNHGSQNAGLTNTLRCFGKGAAALTLAGDLSKGVIAVLFGRLVFTVLGVGIGSSSDISFVGYLAGIFAILGHIFPLYYGFKGGKGILVASSILIINDPIVFCILIPSFLIISVASKYVSIGSISAAILYPLVVFIKQYLFDNLPANIVIVNISLVMATSVLLIFMHTPNIKRLIAHTENKFIVFNKSKYK